ncbi:MAG: hydroxyacylglutathione hydrolase family protein [Candidatus Eisenbacteria bacterium]|nr:hydroxyacylglutathione hydrolase family protein [Candidatus Eisenbacteria bacterium]
MILEQIPIPRDRNFAYLIGDEASREAAIVDPGYGPEEPLRRAAVLRLQVVWVINTHGHPDHAAGTGEVVQRTGARLAAFGRGDRPLRDGDVVPLGSLEIRVLHTPEHTPDSICLLAGGDLLTGDTLFVGKIGGTDGEAAAREEYDALRGKICSLPPETRVWPGHDYGVRPSSTVGEEIRTNPFLLRPDFAAFLELKGSWAEYKRKHGIR